MRLFRDGARKHSLSMRLGLALFLGSLSARAQVPVVSPASSPDDVNLETKSVASALTIRYEGGCVEASEVAARVRRWLRNDSVDRRLSIVVEGGDAEKGRALSFVVFSDGEMVAVRRFGALAGECDSVLAVLSFSIAVSIDASVSERAAAVDAEPVAAPAVMEKSNQAPAVKEKSGPASAPEKPTSVLRAVSQTKPAKVSTDRSQASAVPLPKGSFTAAAFGASGMLPERSLGAEVMARIWLKNRLAPGLGLIATSLHTFSVGKAGASASLVAARADVQTLWAFGPLHAGLGLGILAGSAEVAGLDLVRAKSVAFLWSAVEARGVLELPVSSYLALHSGVGGCMALTRPVLDVRAPDGKVAVSRVFPGFGINVGLGLTATLR